MIRLSSLRSVFGWDKNAVDLADNLSGNSSRENIQKVLGGLRMRQIFYRGPRFLMRSFTGVAKVFKPSSSKTSPSPYVD
ncbi:MAG: hypothetical protein DI586_08095 [Micavibrio aeruginosavorus]|uniref:Uncharacterized protein n=1 Tax=Micavibrio aeruginosavorus TaxID=349221 RepID=A0A2W5HAC6_9BACT|nr:MAG: hypothetical protein DI586_08095 [Micavibrio aeruginosavorus]